MQHVLKLAQHDDNKLLLTNSNDTHVMHVRPQSSWPGLKSAQFHLPHVKQQVYRWCSVTACVHACNLT